MVDLSPLRVYAPYRKQREGAVRLRNQYRSPYKDEDSLIAAYLAGDLPAVEYVAHQMGIVMKRFPYLREQTDDIVQEVHARLIRNLKEGKFSRRCSFEHYIRTIALYVCIDLVRRRNLASPIDDSDPYRGIPDRTDSILEILTRREDVDRMKSCLEQLSAVCRDLLRLRFWEEKAHGEIARLMGIAESTSRVRLKRCLDRLGQLFRKREKGKQ